MSRFLLLLAALMLAAPASAQTPRAAPDAESEAELRASILAAVAAPDFRAVTMQLEVYRTLNAAGVTLSSADRIAMAEEARKSGLPAEALAVVSPLFPGDVPLNQEAAEYKVTFEHLRRWVDRERSGELEQMALAAASRRTPRAWLYTADSFASHGHFERAVEFYERSIFPEQLRLSTDILTRAAELARAHRRAIEFYVLGLKDGRYVGPNDLRQDELAMAQLNYGIALFKLNRLYEARATWESIQGDAAGILARAWLDIAAQ